VKPLERWRVIVPLLVLSVGSAWWLRAGEHQPEATIYTGPQRVARVQLPATAEQVELRQRPVKVKTTDVFVSRSWYVPPPPPTRPAMPVLPPAPSAPPLPFAYLGKIEETGRAPVFFLQKADKMYTVSAGDTIDGVYRVEGETGGRLRLTYLPMDLAQAVELGSGP
jgi:hypothetical protein